MKQRKPYKPTNQIKMKSKSNQNQNQIKSNQNQNQIKIKSKSNQKQIKIKSKSNQNQIKIKSKSNQNQIKIKSYQNSYSSRGLLIGLFSIIVLFGTKKLRNIGEDLGHAFKSFRRGIQQIDEEKKNIDNKKDEVEK